MKKIFLKEKENRSSCRGRYCKHFSLIELLITISIIAILAALLLPVLNKARDKGREITCVSQMKQVGSAVIMYCNDNDDYLPTYNHNTALDKWSSGWSGIPDLYLASYLKLPDADIQAWGIMYHDKVNNVMRCPMDTIYAKKESGKNYYMGSYAVILNSKDGSTSGPGWMECEGNGGQGSKVTYHRLSSLRGASVLFIEMERKDDGTLKASAPLLNAGGGNYDCIKTSIADTAETRSAGFQHNSSRSANYGRADGSVHSVSVGMKWKEDLSF